MWRSCPSACVRRRWCACRSCPATCTTSRAWPSWGSTSSTATANRRPSGADWLRLCYFVVVAEEGGGLFDGLCDRHDAVEAGGVEQPHERGAVAAHGHVAAALPGPADASDQGPE